MKTYEIVTRVAVYEELATIAAANTQQERDTGDETGIRTIGEALEELSHFGDPHHPDRPRGPLDCGVEILRRDVREVEAAPCFPPQVAQAHAAELRQALADLLEWNAWENFEGEEWQNAQALMTQIRDEEDAAREGRS